MSISCILLVIFCDLGIIQHILHVYWFICLLKFSISHILKTCKETCMQEKLTVTHAWRLYMCASCNANSNSMKIIAGITNWSPPRVRLYVLKVNLSKTQHRFRDKALSILLYFVPYFSAMGFKIRHFIQIPHCIVSSRDCVELLEIVLCPSFLVFFPSCLCHAGNGQQTIQQDL